MIKNIVFSTFALLSPLAFGADITVTVTDQQTGEPVSDAILLIETRAENAPISAEIVQKDREFRPNSIIIPAGSSVSFPNRDNTQHHVYSFSPAKVFDIELYAGVPEAPVVFDQSGIVEIGCNIHDHMQGFILVTEGGITARTTDTGQAILSLPEGEEGHGQLVIKVWHPRLPDNTRLVEHRPSDPLTTNTALTLDLIPEPSSDGRLDSLQQRFRDL